MNQENIVYSTDPNFSLTSDIVESESILNDNQNLRVHLDRRKGLFVYLNEHEDFDCR